MKNYKRSFKTIVLTSLLVVLTFSSLGYAASKSQKVLKAWYGTINIIYNGKNVTQQLEPFVADDTSYIPLRTVANIFDKDVQWDDKTFTATINDKTNSNVGQLQNQILIKDIEITELKRKIENLEDDLNDDKRGDKSIKSLEKDLNYDYDRYESIDFDISLKSSNSDKDIDVRIEVDLSRDKSRWNSLSTRRKEDLIKSITDDVLYEFPKADITGYIRDKDDRKDLLTFRMKSNGRLTIDDEDDRGSSSSVSLRSLERDLERNWNDYFRNVPVEITLKGDSDDVKFYVNVDYYRYKSEWNKLSDSEIKRLMSNIYDDIEDEWRRADIIGYAYDTDKKDDLAEYYKSSSGKETFDRY